MAGQVEIIPGQTDIPVQQSWPEDQFGKDGGHSMPTVPVYGDTVDGVLQQLDGGRGTYLSAYLRITS